MEFKEILTALAAACGLERLEPDESNMVHLGAQGAALTIIGEDTTRTVVLMSEIGDLPAGGRERFFAEALKANWLFQGGGGATLAINPETDALAINQALPLDMLDGERFVGAVRRFLAVLVRWRTLARDWNGAVGDGAAGASDAAVPSGGSAAQPGDAFVLWG